MQYIYALINFLLLIGIVWLIGRKKIAAMFRTRRERIARELDEAEAGLPEFEPVSALPEASCAQESRDAQTALASIAAAAEENRQRLEAQYQRRLWDMRRATLLDERRSLIQEAQKQAAALLSREPYASRFRSRESEIADRILEAASLTPGDMVYLAQHEVLYVTLSSAYPLSEETVSRIGSRAESMLKAVGGKPSFWVQVDESLIGGMRLRIGDSIHDYTLANGLSRIGRALSEQQLSEMEPESILKQMLDAVSEQKMDVEIFQVGRVISVSDGICWLNGLSDIMYGEVVEFDRGEHGMVLDIEPSRVGCIIFGRYEHIESYGRVRRLGAMASVPVGEALLGRVVNPLGEPIDGKGRIWATERRPVECRAPAIPDRKSVSVPLQTGIKAIDALVPIGRGQRELIIGDRQTGKTAIAIDTILHQRGKNVVCIYVAIGQKEASVAEIVSKLEKYGAMDYTTVVSATASTSASMQYVAPFSGAAMSEYFMNAGRDALIIYDDLSKHAVAYRELSLLLHRPSGREAYPGDIFYLHARLLERAAQLSDEAGGGSVTALPIIETQAGDISAYIPTNVISITDGQIFLETSLFNEGQRPAVNVGLSVSRVGGAAQTPLMKQVSSRLRMSLAQYRELATFALFGSELNDSTRKVLDSGARMTAALRQGRDAPMPDWQQALLIFAVSEGFADGTAPEDMEGFSDLLTAHFETAQPELTGLLATGKKLGAASVRRLRAALTSFVEAG